MIVVNNVTKSYSGRTLFDEVTVQFHPGNRYALTGPNGAGKSTFMKILSGEVEPTNNGTVSRPKKVGVLRQDQFAFDEERIIDTVMMGNGPLWYAMKERDELYEAGDFSDEKMARLGEVEEIISDENGYMAEVEAAELLRGIGLSDDRHEELMYTLPTDIKFRVLLAQAMFGGPQALLLDEPTNHMDLDSIHWLEGFLHDYNGVLIVISHDRHFLNAVSTHVADIDYDTIIIYPGDYDDMVAAKAQARSTIESDNKSKEKKIAQLQEFVARFGAGQRSSQVQSRKKEIERLAPEDLKRSNIQRPYIRFEQNKPSGREVVVATDIAKSWDGSTIFEGVNLEIMRGDKVAIIGGNGAGKSTLIRCLLGETSLDGGEVKWGNGMVQGYYPQDTAGQIEPGVMMSDWLMRYEPNGEPQNVRALLGRLLFTGDDALKSTEVLSGGETARLLLARLMLLQAPVLIFDEPTNHLDLESVNALSEGLDQFEGTVLLVSHDRDLISSVATRILAFTEDGIRDFLGTYEEYRERYPITEKTHASARR
jgi:ATPase subunit of ABC transporter with duplicated ATPase domains